jgi:outer membrane cobalamin receptor
MKSSFYFFGILVFFGISGTILADDPPPAPGSITTLEEIVVTATKTQEKRKDIPNNVITKDEQDIQDSPAKGFGELLANEPGLDLRSYGDYGGAVEALRIRGMSDQGTQVLVNGISLNSPSLGQADLGGIPLNNIERVEVVKGSGSLLYGSGAMGGTVNIITKSPQKNQTNCNAAAGYGSNQSAQFSLAQGMFTSEHFGYFFTAHHAQTDGFRDNGDMTQTDLSLKLLWDQKDRLKISLYGDYLDRASGVPGPQPPAGTPDYYLHGTHFYSPESSSLVNHGRDENGHTLINIEGRAAAWCAFSVQAGYSDLKNYYFNRNVVDLYPKLAGEGEKTWVVNQVNEYQGHVELKPLAQIDLLLGAEYKGFDYERETVDLNSGGEDKPNARAASHEHVFTKAALAEAQYRFNDSLKALAGIRHEDHSKFGGINLYRYGLAFNPYKNTAVKFNQGRHFRAPTLNDLYWPDDGWTRGNPDLKPETGWHTDLTLEQSFLADKLFFTASYFYWDVKDKIAWAENPAYPTSIPGMNKWTPANVDSAAGAGWELAAKIGPFRHMQFDLSYSRMDIQEQKKDCPQRQAVETPAQLFKGSLTYWYQEDATVNLTARYVGDRPADYRTDQDVVPQHILDSYWTLDLKWNQRLAQHWSLFVQANNFLDEAYTTRLGNFVASDGSFVKADYPGAGRSFFMGLTYVY